MIKLMWYSWLTDPVVPYTEHAGLGKYYRNRTWEVWVRFGNVRESISDLWFSL